MADQLQQQLAELSGQLSETVNQLKITDANLVALDTEKRRNELTFNEVQQYEETRNLYKPVGRAYVLMGKAEMTERLQVNIARNEAEIQEMRTRQEALCKRRDEVSNNIQELVSSLKQ